MCRSINNPLAKFGWILTYLKFQSKWRLRDSCPEPFNYPEMKLCGAKMITVCVWSSPETRMTAIRVHYCGNLLVGEVLTYEGGTRLFSSPSPPIAFGANSSPPDDPAAAAISQSSTSSQCLSSRRRGQLPLSKLFGQQDSGKQSAFSFGAKSGPRDTAAKNGQSALPFAFVAKPFGQQGTSAAFGEPSPEPFSFGTKSGPQDTSAAKKEPFTAPFSFGTKSGPQDTSAANREPSPEPFFFGGKSGNQDTSAAKKEPFTAPFSFGTQSGPQDTSAANGEPSPEPFTFSTKSGRHNTSTSKKEPFTAPFSFAIIKSGPQDTSAATSELSSLSSSCGTNSGLQGSHSKLFEPGGLMNQAEAPNTRRNFFGQQAAHGDERHAVIHALFETQSKCLQIQNALHKLLLSQLKVFLAKTSTEAKPDSASQDEDTKCAASSVALVGDTRQGTVGEDSVPEELTQPLDALLRCSGVQVALQKKIAFILTLPGHTDSEPTTKTGEWLHGLFLLLLLYLVHKVM